MYSREIDGQILTLSASGWTYNDTFVLYDYETESLWYPFISDRGLTCISGTYADRFLPEVFAQRMRFEQWFAQEPMTKYMACKRIGAFGCAGN